MKRRYELLWAAATVVLAAGTLLPVPCLAGLGKAQDAEFRDTPELPLGFEAAWNAVEQALAPYKVRERDQAAGQITSRYVMEEAGPNRYRTAVTAVVQRRGQGTVVSVRAQRELLLEALTPGVFAPSPKWQKVGTNKRIQDAVLGAILKAAGVEVVPPVPASGGSPTPAGMASPPPSAAVPPPSGWNEIQRLKEERNRLMVPVRELDRKVLEVVYAPDADARSAELRALREQRNRAWEKVKAQVMEIDQKILELALQD